MPTNYNLQRTNDYAPYTKNEIATLYQYATGNVVNADAIHFVENKIDFFGQILPNTFDGTLPTNCVAVARKLYVAEGGCELFFGINKVKFPAAITIHKNVLWTKIEYSGRGFVEYSVFKLI